MKAFEQKQAQIIHRKMRNGESETQIDRKKGAHLKFQKKKEKQGHTVNNKYASHQ